MRKYFKYKLIGLGLIIIGIAACDTAEQDVSPIISPDGKPEATFDLVPGTTITEGDTVIYTITTDKKIERSITFSFQQTGGTATEDDYVVIPGVIEPYKMSTQVTIITANDNVLGDAKTMHW